MTVGTSNVPCLKNQSDDFDALLRQIVIKVRKGFSQELQRFFLLERVRFISLNGVAARDLIRSRVPAIECPTRRILLRTFATSLTKALAGDPRLHGAAGVS